MTDKPLSTIAALTESDLSSLAGRMVPCLRQGDILLLDGSLGAGKTSFARALIRHYFDDDALEVPSPTFSLAQCYEAGDSETDAIEPVPIWHFDLYRIEDGTELVELGLEDALDTGISLIEWPDRLSGFPGGYPLGDALTIRLEIADQGMRNVTLLGGQNWRDRLPPNLGGKPQ